MEITCSGCATDRTTVSHRSDADLKHVRFLREIFGKIYRTVVHPDMLSGRYLHISLQSPIMYLSL
jgi:hypothetical protein